MNETHIHASVIYIYPKYASFTHEVEYSSVPNNRLLPIIIRAEIKSEVRAQKSFRQKSSEVTGPINSSAIPRHRINLNNPPGKKKIKAILSKVTEPNTGKG